MELIDDFTDEDKVTETRNFWEPVNLNDTIIGIIIKSEEGKYGKQWTLSVSEGEELTLPNLYVIDSKLKESNIGDIVKIVYLGEVDTAKGKPYKNFEIYRKSLPQENKETETEAN